MSSVTTLSALTFEPSTLAKRNCVNYGTQNPETSIGRIVRIVQIYSAKNGLEIHGFICVEDPSIMMVTISGHRDDILMSAGKLYNMPRGCHAVFAENVWTTYNFYPKFGNDSNTFDLSNATRCEFSKKFSGSLGLVTVVKKSSGEFAAIACSKNAPNRADSVTDLSYPRKVFEGFMKFASDNLIDEIYNNKLALLFETLIPEDPHACFAKELTAVLIAVSTENKVLGPIVPGPASSKDLVGPNNQNPIAVFFNSKEIHDFAVRNGIPIESRIIATGDNAKKFYWEVDGIRNNVTNASYDDLIKEYSDSGRITVFPGTISHATTQGDILEGVIIRLFFNGSETAITTKFKFANYTRMTFGIRAYLQVFQKHLIDAKKTPKPDIDAHIERYAAHWLTPDDSVSDIKNKLRADILRIIENNPDLANIKDFARKGIHLM
jgi:hypothetical protein